MRFRLLIALCLSLLGSASAEEYPISNPTQPTPSPVYLTRPVEGRVDVGNLPAVQDVRIVGGRPEEPMEVRGEVGLRVTGPLQVEVTNPQKASPEVQVVGNVKIDDTQPVRVWMENQWNPENPSAQEFAAYVFQGRFLPNSERFRRLFSPRAGKIFYLTDLIADPRPDASLKVRVMAGPKSLAGSVTGVEYAEFPLAVLDLRRSSSVRFSTPVPVNGEFSLEVEVLGATQGGYFSAVALGYLVSRP